MSDRTFVGLGGRLRGWAAALLLAGTAAPGAWAQAQVSPPRAAPALTPLAREDVQVPPPPMPAIDPQLRQAGWDADTVGLSYRAGARPTKGRNMAIAEWPTASGPADYVLFAGYTPIGVVEAKRQAKDVSAAIEQAKRYSRGFLFSGEHPAAGGPWGDFGVPFLFATNGRPFLRQLAGAVCAQDPGPGVVDWLWQIFMQTSPNADATLAELAHSEQRELLASLAVPVLSIIGSADGFVAPDIGRAAATIAARGRCVEYPGCGHAPFLEAPERYRADLAAFLAELR